MQPEYSSCQQLLMFERVPSGIYTIRTPDGTRLDDSCNNGTGITLVLMLTSLIYHAILTPSDLFRWPSSDSLL